MKFWAHFDLKLNKTDTFLNVNNRKQYEHVHLYFYIFLYDFDFYALIFLLTFLTFV